MPISRLAYELWLYIFLGGEIMNFKLRLTIMHLHCALVVVLSASISTKILID
jgi:hypothetical protein